MPKLAGLPVPAARVYTACHTTASINYSLKSGDVSLGNLRRLFHPLTRPSYLRSLDTCTISTTLTSNAFGKFHPERISLGAWRYPGRHLLERLIHLLVKGIFKHGFGFSSIGSCEASASGLGDDTCSLRFVYHTKCAMQDCGLSLGLAERSAIPCCSRTLLSNPEAWRWVLSWPPFTSNPHLFAVGAVLMIHALDYISSLSLPIIIPPVRAFRVAQLLQRSWAVFLDIFWLSFPALCPFNHPWNASISYHRSALCRVSTPWRLSLGTLHRPCAPEKYVGISLLYRK